MKHPTTTFLTPDQYRQLMTHASREADFVHIGSTGTGPGRGIRSGFAACAVESLCLEQPLESPLATDELARKMEDRVSRHQLDSCAEMPLLTGGWIGFISYELGYLREPRLAGLCPDLPVPIMSAGFYLWTASHILATDQYCLWVHPECPAATRNKLEHWLDSPAPASGPDWHMPGPFRPRQSPESFMAGVTRIKDYIEAGDCYQANLSQQFTGHYQGDPWQAFQALSRANPTPYSAFIRTGDGAIVSVSPERFLEIRNNTILTSPIKGTRPRGATPEQDEALASELVNSEKDRAENLMIVDLLRNDLGVNAATGSVSVDQLFALESYRNVHHLVSHIRARLAPGITPIQALLEAFPGGSITGAPKIRAMEIIRELEPHWRGPYCGSVFFRGLDGTLDSSIAIRTLHCDGEGKINCWGGGGIVADSDAGEEYQETLTKVRSLMQFLEQLGVTE